ncbi:MAG: ABC transporter permease [Gallionella sp.]|jgi:phospholipid/cholesterol/gamma-HCH transport system permease protein|nr:ABC transporter permease [Gallionella sp.]
MFRFWGKKTLTMLLAVSGYLALLAYGLSHGRVLRIEPVRKNFYRQIFFSGNQALHIIGFMGLLLGIIVSTQTFALAGGDSSLVVKVMAWVIVWEIGPLFAAIIIIARSGSAIAVELALMRVSGEVASLEQMGIAPLDFLVVPRILGVTISVVALTAYFQIVAVVGGLAVSAMFKNVGFLDQIHRFVELVNPWLLMGGVLKSLVFGLVIATISCHHGISVGTATSAVPQAAIKAVIRAMLAVFLLDILFALIRLM